MHACRHRLQHWPLSIDGGRIGRNGLTLALDRLLLFDLRDDPFHFRLVVFQLYLLFSCGGWGSLPGTTVALACEPPSASELCTTTIPCLDNTLVVVHGGIDIRDCYLVTGFDIARCNEM